jgi:hypothetical protein
MRPPEFGPGQNDRATGTGQCPPTDATIVAELAPAVLSSSNGSAGEIPFHCPTAVRPPAAHANNDGSTHLRRNPQFPHEPRFRSVCRCSRPGWFSTRRRGHTWSVAPAKLRQPRLPELWLTYASIAVSGWSLAYAMYRGYYAVGGTGWLPGRPADPAQFRLINGAAAIILLVAAAAPLVLLPFWRRRRTRLVALALCWVVAVGCVTHALINVIQRILSLAGLLRIEYPASVWASINSRTADLQDLFFNEPWFLLEGLGFALLAWIVLGPGPGRRRWIGIAIAATAILTVVGLLSAFGLIGKVIVG